MLGFCCKTLKNVVFLSGKIFFSQIFKQFIVKKKKKKKKKKNCTSEEKEFLTISQKPHFPKTKYRFRKSYKVSS